MQMPVQIKHNYTTIIWLVAITLFNFTYPVNSRASCLEATETINLKIVGDRKDHDIRLIGNKVKIKKSKRTRYDPVTLTNVCTDMSDSRSILLPRIDIGIGFNIDMPYIYSEKNKLLAAAVHDNKKWLGPTKTVAIIDTAHNKLIHTIHLDHRVISLYFSPQIDKIAFLVSEDVTEKRIMRPIDILAKSLGHQFSYDSIYLYIYSISGNLLCKKTVLKNLRHGNGHIVSWTKAK